MSADLLTPSNITFVLGLLGVLFGVYQYFRNPQIDTEKKDALLAQQVQWEKEVNEKRFSGIQDRLDSVIALTQNHVHEIDIKIDALTESVSEVKRELVRLSTIVEERMPKKL